MATHEDLIVDVMIAGRQKLLGDLRRHVDQVAILFEQAERAVLRNGLRRADVGRLLERHTERRSARQLHALIAQKMLTGHLPEASAPRIFGAPGVDGRCDACEKPLLPSQVVMSIPWRCRKTFAHLHADCFVAWNAVRHSRAALARLAYAGRTHPGRSNVPRPRFA